MNSVKEDVQSLGLREPGSLAFQLSDRGPGRGQAPDLLSPTLLCVNRESAHAL